MEPVSIVTIKQKIPLYKGNELANKVELILLEELGFELVVQKNLYNEGDKAVYIQPDYCLSEEVELFNPFIKPNGDESKSILGKVGGKPRRIKAKKFLLSKTPNGDYVYSNGILIPMNDVKQYLSNIKNIKEINIKDYELTKELKVFKYEEPELSNSNNLISKFPENVYKTDEENILNLRNKIKFPICLVGTEKVDGSSITFGYINGEKIICSRNQRKPIKIQKCIGYRNKKWYEKLLFWVKFDLREIIEVNNEDDFVKHALPLLNKIPTSYKNILFRGELNGGNLKGSGNKNNPSRLEKPNIKIFGIDLPDNNGIFKKCSYNEYKIYIDHFNLNPVKEIFIKEFTSFDSLINECDSYFKDNLIEGIVVKTLDSKFSTKIMNLEYDFLK